MASHIAGLISLGIPVLGIALVLAPFQVDFLRNLLVCRGRPPTGSRSGALRVHHKSIHLKPVSRVAIGCPVRSWTRVDGGCSVEDRIDLV